MTTKISIILLLCAGRVLSQYESPMKVVRVGTLNSNKTVSMIYMRSDARSVPYEKTRQEIVNNFLSNKPLLNYVPVYSTNYGQWEPGKDEPLKKYQTFKPKVDPDADFQKLGDVITKLKTEMQTLSQQTRSAYEDKLKELDEVKKLNEDLKLALQNTEVLKNSLHEHERQLNELTKNIQDRNEFPSVNPAGIEEFLNMIESLELMVRNISCKYGRKLGM